MVTFKTAVEYQFLHSLALILIAILILSKPHAKYLPIAGLAILTGIILFLGSLYLLALTSIKFFGIITPIGGIAFLTGTFGAQTPVLSIDGRRINEGSIGAITQQLRKLYKELVAEDCS